MSVVDVLRDRLLTRDPVNHHDYLVALRAQQVAGQLKNPAATGPLIDRFEAAISRPARAAWGLFE